MREAILIHMGQAGAQIGNACWELFCLEHGAPLFALCRLSIVGVDTLCNGGTESTTGRGAIVR